MRFTNATLRTSTMAASITAALSTFAQAVSNVVFAVFHAALAVFQAVIALFSEIATGILQIGQAVVKLATDLVQDTLGFVFGGWFPGQGDSELAALTLLVANLFVILLLGGAYYWYANTQGAKRTGKRRA